MKPTISLERKYGRTFLWQWDINMRLELGNIPPGTQVDFENLGDENCGALPIMSYEDNGLVYVEIPNKLLMTPGTLVVYVYLFDEARGYTKLRKTFLIIGRAKPDSYVYNETKAMTWQQLDDRIKHLESNEGSGGGCDCGDGDNEDSGDNVVEFDGVSFGTSENEGVVEF